MNNYIKCLKSANVYIHYVSFHSNVDIIESIQKNILKSFKQFETVLDYIYTLFINKLKNRTYETHDFLFSYI